MLWDEEFQIGHWDYLEHTLDDPIYPYLEKYADAGTILDLGCGSGNTGNELNPAKYESYTGADLSETAVYKAVARSKANRREQKNEYVCADIESYVPQKRYNIILFRESLFYVPMSRIKKVIDRYFKYLTDNGVIIVRMCDRQRYKPILNLITKNYRVIEEYPLNEAKDVIIIFTLRHFN